MFKDTLDSIPSLPQDSSKSDGKPVPYHDDMVAALLERGTRLRNAMVSLSDSAQSVEHTSQSGGSVTDALHSARSNVQVKDKRHGYVDKYTISCRMDCRLCILSIWF